MSIKRCPTCNGKKKVAPLGFIQKECPTCGGIGYTSKNEKLVNPKKDEELEIKDKNPVLKPMKRRGRPPRNLIDIL